VIPHDDSTPPGKERLVLNFHGIGNAPARVGPGERQFWATESAFAAMLDDGNDSDARLALPALLERGLTADFFVCAGRLGQPGYLDEHQLLELRDAGMRIGSHGWSHVDWRRADDATMDRELRGARERLAEILGYEVAEVAIPFGSYDRRVIGMLRRHGVQVAYTSDGGRASSRSWLVSRETCTAAWEASTIRRIAGTGPSARARVRRSLACLVKRLR
jgi:peptidoglycan/xylan/chitin deacetylase (PgdA/CDA1 family)